MESPLFKAILAVLLICMLHSALDQNEALAGVLLKIYYEQNAQVELINSEGSRVLIDVHDPTALSSPPTVNDVLLTTHNHGDHRRLDCRGGSHSDEIPTPPHLLENRLQRLVDVRIFAQPGLSVHHRPDRQWR